VLELPWNDPVAKVTFLLRRDRAWMWGALLVAATGHAAAGWGLPRFVPVAMAMQAPPRVVDLDLSTPPAPPPASPPRSEPAQTTPRLPAPRPTRAVVASRSPAPPASPPPEILAGPLDFTGTADAVATGYSESGSRTYGARSGTPGAPPGAAVVAAPSRAAAEAQGPDLSRSAEVTGGKEWNCPFPPEADGEGTDDAVATIRVAVSASGKVERVSVLSDPGHGFGAAAERCATSREWSAAVDRGGRAVRGERVVAVRFVR